MVGDFRETQELREPAAKEGLNFSALMDEGLFAKPSSVAAKVATQLADGGNSPGTYEPDPDNPRRPDREDEDEPRRPHEDDDLPPFLMEKKKFDGGGSPGTYEPDEERRPGGGDDDDPDMPRRPGDDEEYPPFILPRR